MSLGIAVMLTIVAFHAVLAQNQVALDHTRERIAAAEDRYENQRLKYSLLSSPARVTQRATELGMVPPDVAPISVAIPGEAPKRGNDTTAFGKYQEVKRHLDSSP